LPNHVEPEQKPPAPPEKKADIHDPSGVIITHMTIQKLNVNASLFLSRKPKFKSLMMVVTYLHSKN
jgi:hypothetical protein